MLTRHLPQFLSFLVLLFSLIPLTHIQASEMSDNLPETPQNIARPTGAPTPAETPVPPSKVQTLIPLDAMLLDDFNRPDGSVGGTWVGMTAGYTLSNTHLSVENITNTPLDLFWSESSFGADQEASFYFVSIDPNSEEIGLILKSQGITSGSDLVEVFYKPSGPYVQIWTKNGSGWNLHGGNILVSFAPGDKLSARANAYGQVEVLKNDVLLAARDITSWPYYANTGFIGLFNYNSRNTVLDDFGGGSISSYPSPTPTAVPCYDPQSCNPVTAYNALWRCDIPECTTADWKGAVITWPSWSSYPNNARSNDQSRTVYSRDGDNILYPYMGPWADGCQVTAVSGTVVIIEWERGTDTWVETQLEVGQTHTISLTAPQNNAMIEGPNEVWSEFVVSLANCTPQDIFSTPTSTPTPLPTSVITMGETNPLIDGDVGNLGNVISAQPATLSDRSSLQSISLLVSNPAGQLRLGIYSDIGGYPGNLLIQSPSIPSTSDWTTYNFPSPHITLDAGNYWLAFLPEDNALTVPIGNTSLNHYYNHPFGNMINPYPNVLASAPHHYSLYATFVINDPTNIAIKSLEATPLAPSETFLRMMVLFLLAVAILAWFARNPKRQPSE